MSARDELARDVFLADNVNAPAGLMEAEWDGNKGDETYAHMIADGLIAAGYSKPRTITTAAELDALPDGAIILEVDGSATKAVKRMDGKNWWIDGPNATSSSELIPLPVTVIHEPDPTTPGLTAHQEGTR